MRALTQTQDQLQRQASPSPVRLVAAPSGPEQRTQPILELQRTLGNRAVQRRLRANAEELVEHSSQPAGSRLARNLAPPPRNSIPTPERRAALAAWLTAHMAGHPLAETTYSFYEVIDEYLGPWGSGGYLIGYGKHYNILFTTNQALMAHPVASAWVWKTTILLQQLLANFIVARYDAGTLSGLTEAELREAAFASHPLAYTEGGLTLVALVAPELIAEIVKIPRVEFIPGSENFAASWEQFITTGSMVAPRMLGDLIAAAMPAHSGLLQIAVERDQRRFLDEIQLNRYLGRIKRAIAAGELNNISVLQQITQRLITQEFPDQDMARAAREVIQLADQRKAELAEMYAEAVKKHPELKAFYDRTQAGWEAWLKP